MMPVEKSVPDPFLAFVADEVTGAVLARIAKTRGWPGNSVLAGGPAEAVATLAGIATPRLLLIDLSECAEPVADLAALAEVCDPGTRLVTMGSVNDVHLFRAVMELGAEDYLLKPVAADALEAALDRADEPAAAADEPGLGRLVAVIGARGGVGASTVAINIAWMMAHEQGLRVALVDLDVYFGTISLALDLEPGRGFREALENPGRIDGLFIERAMVRASDNLFVLGAEEALANPFSFDPAALDLLLEKLRHGFDCVVVDLPRFAARTQVGSLAAPAAVAVVSDSTLAGMRDTLRLVELVREEAPAADLRVVVNRAGGDGRVEMTKADFQRGADLSVDHVIPCEAKAASASSGAGKALAEVAGRGRMASALRRLSRDLSGSDGAVVKAPAWQRLLRRGR